MYNVEHHQHDCDAEQDELLFPTSCLQKLQTCHLIDPNYFKTKLVFKSNLGVKNERKRQRKVRKFVIHPFSSFRRYWDYMMAVVWFIFYCLLPYQISNKREISLAVAISTSILTAICNVDILFWFLTGFYVKESNMVVLQHGDIVRNYLMGYFVPDVLSSAPYTLLWYLLDDLKEYWYLHLFKFLKVFRLGCCLTRVKEFLMEELGFWSYQVKLALIVLILIFLYSIGQTLFPLSHDQDIHYTWAGLISFLANVMSSLVLANYDYHKKNVWRALYHIFMTMLGYSIKLAFMGLLMQIYISRTSVTNRVEAYLANAEQYATFRALPEDLRARIRNYFDYCLRMNIIDRETIHREIHFMPALNKDMLLHEWRDLVIKVDIFKELPFHVVNRITNVLKSEVNLLNDVIYEYGVIHNSMYFVNSGNLAIYGEDGVEIGHLTDGDYFGLVGILSKSVPQMETVVAITTCELLRLYRKEFLKVVRDSPTLSERSISLLQSIKDSSGIQPHFRTRFEF